jgi:hypothetical protein
MLEASGEKRKKQKYEKRKKEFRLKTTIVVNSKETCQTIIGVRLRWKAAGINLSWACVLCV